jgi:chemotaxis response regulator CheB
MKLDRALLLDLNAAEGLSLLGTSLREILQPHFSIEVLTKRDLDIQAANLTDDLGKIIKRFNPDLIFFLVSPYLANSASKLVELVGEFPTILVMDGTKPNEVLELLKIGANDFNTSP